MVAAATAARNEITDPALEGIGAQGVRLVLVLPELDLDRLDLVPGYAI